MDNDDKDGLMVSIVIFLFAFVFGMVFGNLVVNSYKLGQIDAINGDIKYELRELYQGEMKWKRIQED